MSETIKPSDFLTYSKSKDKGNKYEINSYILFEYLTQEGYRSMELGDNKYGLCRVIGNVLRMESMQSVCHYLMEQMDSIPHKALFVTRQNFYFKQSQIKLLPKVSHEMMRDTRDKCFIPFSNGIVVISKDNITINPLESTPEDGHLIFEDNIIEREVRLGVSMGDFHKFVSNAVNEHNLEIAMRAIGYLVHNYKDPAVAKIIAFVDAHDKSSEHSNGGTGKSLIATEAIRHVRKLIVSDGKQFNKDDQFKFQGVTEDVSVYAIEDIRRNIDLTTLFNACTGDFQVRDLHKSAKRIPFKKSPKLVLTSNFGIITKGESEKRRIVNIGFYNHYNSSHTPRDEFGKTFFSYEWSDKDWNEFYNFMFKCVQLYLQKGVESTSSTELGEKALRQEYGQPLFNAVKARQEEIKFKHEHTRLVSAFEQEFYASGIEQERKKYLAIREIMEFLGWEYKHGTAMTYTSWALPEEEANMASIQGISKQRRTVYWYEKK